MTGLTDNDRQDYRDEAAAAGHPAGSPDLRDRGPDSDLDYGERQPGAPAYPDRADTEDYPEPGAAAYPDRTEPAARGGADTMLTRDPDGLDGLDGLDERDGLDGGTDGPARAPRSDADPRPDGLPMDTDAGDDRTLVADPDVLMIQWQEVQTGFVDDPRKALHAADELVQQVMQQVAAQFAAERAGMEAQWSRGEDVSTEDLRLVLQRYRTFFNRLLRV